MNTRIITVAVLLMGLVVLAACGGRSTPTPQSPYEGYLTAVIAPCEPAHEHDGPGATIDPCAPGAPSQLPSLGGSRPVLGDKPATIDDLFGVTEEREAWMVPHNIVVRGTYILGTERCTGLTPSITSPFVDLPPGSLVVKCYADVKVHEYLLGTGPERMTTELFTFSPWWAWDESNAKEELAVWEGWLVESEPGAGDGVMGREMILFLFPSMDYTVAAWVSEPGFDVQRLKDGTVVAVHFNRDVWEWHRPEDYAKYRTSHLELTLPALKQAVVAAHNARVEKFGGRIGVAEGLPMLVSDVHGLTDFMVSTLAYEGGGPAQPPPVPGEGDSNPDGVSVDDGTAAPTPTPPGG